MHVRNSLIAVLAACGTAISLTAQQPPPAPAVRVRGNQLVDSAGDVVRLRGLSRSGTEYMCAQGRGIFDGPSDSASVAALAAWHVNVVRVPLNETCWLAINGVKPEYAGDNYRRAIRDFVLRLNRAGMAAILELHWSAPDTVVALGQVPMPDRDHTPEFWREVAAAFASNRHVIFDLFNETYPDNNHDTPEAWRCWKDGGTCRGMKYQAAGMQELINAVRSSGAKNVIMAGGVRYASSVSHWLDAKLKDPLDNLAASWHVYNFSGCNTRGCWDSTAAPVAQRVPLVLGELGQNDHGSAFVTALMDWIDVRPGGVGYLGWSWDVWGDPLDLISSYDGTPTPYGQTFNTRFSRWALATEIRHELKTDDLDAWYPRAVDLEYGGFLSQFDYRWQPIGDQDKMIVTQARHLWMTTRAAAAYPHDTMFRRAAAQGVRFLRERMWDPQDGGFFWLVTRDGRAKPSAEGDPRFIKQSYGEAFGIFAFAAYYDYSRDPSALRFAQRAFHWLDRHAHDAVAHGYFNYVDRDGTPLRAGFAGDPPKDQNSSIHILEAFTELYRVWPDSLLRARLAEMLHLIRGVIIVPPGTLTLFSTADWQPVSWRDSSAAARRRDHFYHDHVSYGHNVETAYLMLEASRALGGAEDSLTLAVGKQMLDYALRTGWDSIGGFYEAGYIYPGKSDVTIVDSTKNWWAQAEGLNALLLFGDLYADDSLHYNQKFATQWRYIDRYLIDHTYGGWYQGGLDKEPERRTDLKGHIWKAMYHDGRALLNVARRLENPSAR